MRQAKRKGRLGKAVLCSLLLAVAVAWICAETLLGQGLTYYLTGKGARANAIRVPQLVGTTYTDGADVGDDFRVSVTYIYSDQPARQILEQAPEAGARRKKAPIELHLTVSMGKPIHRVPELTGLTRREAELALRENGLTPATAEASDGRVLYTRPAAGTRLEAGETVTLYLSPEQPPAAALCPDMVGEDIATAWRQLLEVGLLPGEVRLVDCPHASPGTVLAQELAPGASLPRGRAVGLTVARSYRQHRTLHGRANA